MHCVMHWKMGCTHECLGRDAVRLREGCMQYEGFGKHWGSPLDNLVSWHQTLSNCLCQAIAARGVQHLSPLQAQIFNAGMGGQSVLCHAHPGSGTATGGRVLMMRTLVDSTVAAAQLAQPVRLRPTAGPGLALLGTRSDPS